MFFILTGMRINRLKGTGNCKCFVEHGILDEYLTITIFPPWSLGTPSPVLLLLPPAPHPNHVGIVVAICSALHEHLVTVATFNSRRPARQRQSQQASPINNLFGRQRGVKNLGVVTYCQRAPLPLLTNVRSIPDMNIAYQGRRRRR